MIITDDEFDEMLSILARPTVAAPKPPKRDESRPPPIRNRVNPLDSGTIKAREEWRRQNPTPLKWR